MSDPQFDTWKKLLAIAAQHGTVQARRAAMEAAAISTNLDDPFSGYYRSRRGPDGRYSKDGPFEPVGIWREDGEIVIWWGTDEARLEAIWPGCVMHPVPYEWYAAKLEGKEWPDTHAMPASDEENGKAPLTAQGQAAPSESDRAKASIEAAIKGVADYKTIESDEVRDRAQSFRSSLLELANKTKRRREALIRPHLDAQRDLNALWMPIEKMARAAADQVHAAQEAWATVKIQRQQAEQRRIDEEARAAAPKPDWRDTAAPPPAGDNVPALALTETPQPAPPPTSTSFRGGTGRAAREKAVETVTGFSDQDATYKHFRERAELKALLMKFAQQILDDTGEVVPGVTTETKGRVR